MITVEDQFFLEKAISLSALGMHGGKGGPFGCVIVKGGEIVGEGYNQVTSSNDPTAHAEVVAIRDACRRLQTYQLTGCIVYTSCEPCPMCLGAIYWARPDKVVFANTKEEAAAIAFDDHFIYEQIEAGLAQREIPFVHVPTASAQQVFAEWKKLPGKKEY